MVPDYKKYSFTELEEALASIDKAKWPEKVEQIELLLRSKRVQDEKVLVGSANNLKLDIEKRKHRLGFMMLPLFYMGLVALYFMRDKREFSNEEYFEILPVIVGISFFIHILSYLRYLYLKSQRIDKT